MPRITVEHARGWAENTKLPIIVLDERLLDQLETEVLGRIAVAYDVTTWVDDATTPPLVQVAIAKLYVAWIYRRAYSEAISENDAAYAAMLQTNAEMLITGIADGTIELPGLTTTAGTAEFYPTDASSAMEPTFDDPSLGPAKFSMGQVF